MRSLIKAFLTLGVLSLLPACATTTTPIGGNPNPPPPPGYAVACRTIALPLYIREAHCVPVARERVVVRTKG